MIDRLRIPSFIRKYIRKPYYYVPPCPVCGNKATGRFVKEHRESDTKWIILETLKNGELAKPVKMLPEYNNAFCLNCGKMWFTNIELKFLTLNEIAREKKARHTEEIIISMEAEEKKKKPGIIGHIQNFIGEP